MIDVQLLRLRYEILNISLTDLALENQLPIGTLRAEAANWKQWWPDESALAACVKIEKSEASEAIEVFALDDEDIEDKELSVLEEGAGRYLSCTRLRLQVFNLAKEVLFANRYAALESDMITKASNLISGSEITPQDIRHISTVFKDLMARSSSASISMSQGDDGMPTVIIRDLTGRS